MIKFNSDLAIFATIAGESVDGAKIGDTEISYINNACIRIFGDLRGLSFAHLLNQITNDESKTAELVDKLNQQGEITTEGTLQGKMVKLHSASNLQSCDDSGVKKRVVQAAITDISESVFLKERLYTTSEALNRAASSADEDTGAHTARINRIWTPPISQR